MKWVKFRIKTVTDAEDIIISTLYDLGLEGAQIEDKVPLTAMEKEQMFVDILPDGPEDDGIAYLSFFARQPPESFAGGGLSRAFRVKKGSGPQQTGPLSESNLSQFLWTD